MLMLVQLRNTFSKHYNYDAKTSILFRIDEKTITGVTARCVTQYIQPWPFFPPRSSLFYYAISSKLLKELLLRPCFHFSKANWKNF